MQAKWKRKIVLSEKKNDSLLTDGSLGSKRNQKRKKEEMFKL